jgi:prolyl oligopeptidase
MRFMLAVAVTLATTSAAAADTAAFFPPETPARPVVDVLHGMTLTDRYRWLENGKDPEVAAWTRAQHAATVRYLDRNAPPVPGMKDELARYFDRDKTDPPLVKHGRQFFQRTRRGEPQAALYTRIDGRDVKLFDPVALDPSGRTKIGDVVPNRDATKLAVGVYAQGTERKD